VNNFGLPEIIVIACIVLVAQFLLKVIPFWNIYRKAGFSPTLSVLMLIPIVDIVMLFYLAFAKWPDQKQE
jgi:hypothetical protein